MSDSQTAPNLLDTSFLDMRCRILDLAASFDRIDRADQAEQMQADPRLAKLHEALTILQQKNRYDRAEQIQLLFSDEYVPDWRK